jgi:hypothetical protein
VEIDITDSTLNLEYIKNEDRRFKVFVSNRVAEIHQHSQPNRWHHIPVKMNPADLATRGTTLKKLIPDSQWFKGPCFLKETGENWPTMTTEDLDSNDEEIRKNLGIHTTTKNIHFNDYYTRYSMNGRD